MAREKKQSGSAVPGWIVTFADLMSILVCFFILLLSFSIMDIQRFTEISGSIKNAFGIQEVKALHAVMELDGSPSLPNAETVEVIPVPKITLPTESREGASAGDTDAEGASEGQPEAQLLTQDKERLERIAREIQETEQVAKDVMESLRATLGPEVNNGEVLIEADNAEVKLTFPDRVAFAPGHVEITPQMRDMLTRVGGVLKAMSGQVIVSGHTDSAFIGPTGAGPYRSNWDLSAARAVSVVHMLENGLGIPPDRLVAQGFGDTRPIDHNITPGARARNRRVEIVLRKLLGDTVDGNLLVKPSVLTPAAEGEPAARGPVERAPNAVDQMPDDPAVPGEIGPGPDLPKAPPDALVNPPLPEGTETDNFGTPVLGGRRVEVD